MCKNSGMVLWCYQLKSSFFYINTSVITIMKSCFLSLIQISKVDTNLKLTLLFDSKNIPTQKHSPVTLTPLRSVILVNTSDSSQENHHYHKQCSEPDGTDKNKTIPSRQFALLLNTYSLDCCRCPRHELFCLILSTEILAFHTLIESLILKGADAERLTTL